MIDAGEPRNAPANLAHDVLGRECVSPVELLKRGRAEAQAYGVQIGSGNAPSLATGLVDDLVDILGVATRGVKQCCTVRSATDGKCGTGASRFSPATKPRSTKRCYSANSATRLRWFLTRRPTQIRAVGTTCRVRSKSRAPEGRAARDGWCRGAGN